jgi:pimeloyl-ACP methyl ester carboxylesterase
MSATPPKNERAQIAQPDKKGAPTFNWTTSSSSFTDTVRLIAGPFDVLPVVFIPGIMGSNLKSTSGKNKGSPVWRLDMTGVVPTQLLRQFATATPGQRQQLLNPSSTAVDDQGAVPGKFVGSVFSKETYIQRGWGTVGEGSYHEYLMWLEEQLNPVERNPAQWKEFYQTEATVSASPQPDAKPKLFPGVRMGMHGEPFNAEKQPFVSLTTDDLIAHSKFMMPVYAAGYNWLDSNKVAAKNLSQRIQQIIQENNRGQFRCEQVILVTHSMGGLVARACAQLDGLAELIAGVIHGVMPAVGAAVAYRRCKVGMRDEDFGAGLVIGSTGPEVTAVFAQAPGALQLLPSQAYTPHWLRVLETNGRTAQSWPQADPYAEIYLRRDRWWGLVNEEWLRPQNGTSISWDDYALNIKEAQKFHAKLGDNYHPNTYVFYGADPKQKSFEKVSWRMAPGMRPRVSEFLCKRYGLQ